MHHQVLYIPSVSQEDLSLWLSETAPEKQKRLERFRDRADFLRGLCADHLARQMLSDASGLPRKELIFLHDENGKPRLRDSCLHFNVSHSGDYAACAIADRPVGIDIEVPRSIRPELCKKVCATEEIPYVCPEGRFHPLRFLQLWTAKEAFLKRSGVGIFSDLRRLCCIKDLVITYPEAVSSYFEYTEQYILSVAF